MFPFSAKPLFLVYFAVMILKVTNTNWEQLQQVPGTFDFTSPYAQRWSTSQILPMSQILTSKASLLWSQQQRGGMRTSLLSMLYMSTVLLTGCVETNPGPEYPCLSCGEEVTFEYCAVRCDSCEEWMHTDCMGMDSSVFNFLANTNCMWICPSSHCDMPNFSTSLLWPPITVSTDNSYSLLAQSLRNSSSSTTKSSTNSIHHLSRSHSDRSTKSSMCSTPTSLDTPVATSSPSSVPALATQSPDKLKIAVLNCQSICNKISELEAFLESTQPDIVIASESWLTPDIMSQEVFPSDFRVFRKDRTETFKDMKGGGVFILVSNKLVASPVHIDDPNCELTFAQVDLVGSPKLLVGAFYRPPFTDSHYLDNFATALNSIRHKHPTAHLILGGDFNVGDIDWESTSVIQGSNTSKLCTQVINTADDNSLSQVITLPTRGERLLDLAFTDRPALISKQILAPPLSSKADHSIIILDMDTKAYVPKQKDRISPQYHKANWEALRADTKKYANDFKEMQFSSTQEMWDDIESSIHKLTKQHIPFKQIKGKRSKPWITPEVKSALRRRDRAHRNWRSSRDTKRFNRYQKLRTSAQRTLQ